MANGAIAEDKPRLIFQITVYQLRGDLLQRYFGQFGPDGVRHLMEDGVYYDNAHHAHAHTEAVIGHTTLATGAQPAAQGIVGNLWYDRKAGRTFYNIDNEIDRWSRTDEAPNQIIHSWLDAQAQPADARPVCAYPSVAQYDGSGDPRDASSFSCALKD
ncbi:alkaline phosphatase family protein [Tropicimonas isoalkanivorans]|uniref:alkaline phosphatase family protein n=1 Tax=Tropicimonas isoalkanivorans TaxID=441112 RepID=UPI0015A6CE8B|nr:alkaline phosphatase family protein [Tropicimonas isoalkanivorans]